MKISKEENSTDDPLPGYETIREEQSAQITSAPEVPIKKENISMVPNQFLKEFGTSENSEAQGNIKTQIDAQTLAIGSANGGVEKPTLDSQNNKVTDSDLLEAVIHNLPINLLNNGEVEITNFCPLGKNDGAELCCPPTCDKISCKNENHVGSTVPSSDKPINLAEYEAANEGGSLKTEIELGEIQVGSRPEAYFKSENSNKAPQLQVIIEKLSTANRDHQKAIENLPKLIIKLKMLDSRIIQRVNRQGFVKISSDLLKPLLPQHPKKVYPEGHYFSRKKNVVYDKDEVDKTFFKNALRRGANIDDKGKYLKYKCPKCSYKTLSFVGLAKHHVGLHGVKINWTFTCPDCDFTTRHECTLKRHQQRHKKEPDLPCPHCPYITRFDVALRVHLRRWHLADKEANTLKCTHCNFRSVCKTTYDAHLMVHMKRGENPLSRFLHKFTSNEAEVLKCEYCRFETQHKNGLRRHMQETHKVENPFKIELYRCKCCGFETKHLFSYKDHMLLHKKVEYAGLLQCYNCQFKTKIRKYLVVHMRTEHSRVKKQKKLVTYYHCADCGNKFPSKYLLKTHIFKQHKDSEILMCPECSYTTKTMSVLKRHILTRHVNPKEKVHQCQKCSHISKDKEKHKAHLQTHKCVCYICGFQTLTKGSVRHHIIGHMNKTEQKSVLKFYKCGGCEYESRDKHLYERHMRRLGHRPAKSGKRKVKNRDSDKPLEHKDKLHHFDQPLENPEVTNFDQTFTKKELTLHKASDV